MLRGQTPSHVGYQFGMGLGWLRAFSVGIRDQWERFPSEAQRRGRIWGALAGVWVLASTAVLIASPWGERATILVLFVFAAGGAMLIVMALTALAAVRESRAANERRRARASGR